MNRNNWEELIVTFLHMELVKERNLKEILVFGVINYWWNGYK